MAQKTSGKQHPDPARTPTKGKSELARSSPATRGKQTHSLASAGRKTGRRTQGGARKGAGKGFKL